MTSSYSIEQVFTLLEIMESALAGDYSTRTMPDVMPSEAVRWIWSTLDDKGYMIVPKEGRG